MKHGWRWAIAGASGALVIALVNTVSLGGQAQSAQNQPMAEEVFKNVQLLKGIPVDEFLDTMGMFAAALNKCCSDCHSQGILYDQTKFAESTPEIQQARAMIRMVNALNESQFNGEQKVTCFTCHHGDSQPKTVPSLTVQYGEPEEDPYALEFFPALLAPPAAEVFAKYYQALGGTSRLANLKSFAAKGTYKGFDTNFGEVPVEVLGRAPAQRSLIIHMSGGDSVRTFDGRDGWRLLLATPTPLVTLTGGNLAGARAEAMVSFPLQLQQAYKEWQVSFAAIGDREVTVLQGTNEGQPPINLHFDESGLLVRLIFWNHTMVGHVPTQIDYSDYRDVGGVKMPFAWSTSWTNGQLSVQLSEVQPNVPLDAAKFAKPVLPK
jgi:hypothetical protein